MSGAAVGTHTAPANREGLILLFPLQSDSLVVCDVDPELKEKLKRFRFRKETNNAAIMSESLTACSRAGPPRGQLRWLP